MNAYFGGEVSKRPCQRRTCSPSFAFFFSPAGPLTRIEWLISSSIRERGERKTRPCIWFGYICDARCSILWENPRDGITVTPFSSFLILGLTQLGSLFDGRSVIKALGWTCHFCARSRASRHPFFSCSTCVNPSELTHVIFGRHLMQFRKNMAASNIIDMKVYQWAESRSTLKRFFSSSVLSSYSFNMEMIEKTKGADSI